MVLSNQSNQDCVSIISEDVVFVNVKGAYEKPSLLVFGRLSQAINGGGGSNLDGRFGDDEDA